MTTINCVIDCKYQKDGKCTLDRTDSAGELNENCAYFSPPKTIEKNKAKY